MCNLFYESCFSRWEPILNSWLSSKLELSRGGKDHLTSMEGLRGLAVFLVFCVHYSGQVEPWILSDYSKTIAKIVESFGHLGVDLFFVLSGYLIYGSIIKQENFDVLKYAWRRAERLYPTFITVFLVYLFLSLIFPSESKLPAGLENSLIYILQNILFLPGIFDIEPMITVAWSLSYEVFYYIAIPVIIFTTRLKRLTSRLRIILWSAFTIILFPVLELTTEHTRLLMFVSGILLFEIYDVLGIRKNQGGTICLLLALTIASLQPILQIHPVINVCGAFVFFFAFCLIAFDSSSFTYRWLTFTPLRWLGNMSYSYYLLHGLTLKFGFLVLAKLMPNQATNELLFYWLWIPLFVLTLLTSFILFLFVERPFSLVRK